MHDKKSTLILILIWLIVLIFYFIGIIKIENLANDYAEYNYINGFTIIKYISPESILCNPNMEIEDTLLSINGILIKNKHFLYNRIFEQHMPGDTLEYTLQKKGEIKQINIVLKHRFPQNRRRHIAIVSLIMLILTSVFNLRTKVKNNLFYTFYSLFLVMSILIIYLNIPFSNQFLYSLSIILGGILIINIFIVNSFLIYNSFKKKTFLLLLTPLLIMTILRLSLYLTWTINLSNNTYNLLTWSMKIFHICSIFIVFYCIYIILFKLFNISHSIITRRFLAFVIFYMFLLVLYPIFLALPVVMQNNELIHFDMYLGLFNILLCILILNDKIPVKDDLNEKI